MERWNCKFCHLELVDSTTSEKANHTRWCKDNPSRSEWNTKPLFESFNKRFGEYREYVVECDNCKADFTIKEREKSFPRKEKYYCSKNCANAVGGKSKAAKYHHDALAKYTTIAWRHHAKKCVVCGEDKVVAVHHMNEDHSDNRPENLVPLCPTHHLYWHSKHRHEIEDVVKRYVFNFVNGGG